MTYRTPQWLEKAVIYNLYPQSFLDTNGDGIGDLAGVIEKLDYIKSLGCNAVWLNPIYQSPFQDAGYDVTNHYAVAPRYGSIEDARRLFAEAHKRDMKVLLDLVPGHTSVEHPWFRKAASANPGCMRDRYIWTSNVWESAPAGLTAVHGYAERDGNYLTNFFWFQPALNYGFAPVDPAKPWQLPPEHPACLQTRKEMMKVMRFWLECGADGFRVDMAASLVKGPAAYPVLQALWGEVRDWLEREYPEAVLVSEWSNPKQSVGAGFHMDFLIHFVSTAYTSLFRKEAMMGEGANRYAASYFSRHGRGNIREFLDTFLTEYRATLGKGFVCVPSGNHDICPRLADGRSIQDLKVAFAFLLTLPGVPYLYYGDEIGMRSVRGLPSKEGGYVRTMVRTPMQWNAGKNAGFSSASAENLYLPIDPQADRPCVEQQEGDPDSLLNFVRACAALRRERPQLAASSPFELVHGDGDGPLIFRRGGSGSGIVVAVNPKDAPARVELPTVAAADLRPLLGERDAFQKEGKGWVAKMKGTSYAIVQEG